MQQAQGSRISRHSVSMSARCTGPDRPPSGPVLYQHTVQMSVECAAHDAGTTALPRLFTASLVLTLIAAPVVGTASIAMAALGVPATVMCFMDFENLTTLVTHGTHDESPFHSSFDERGLTG